jgi:dihydrofolate synthase/folylpolyglutamate synthase
MNINHRSFTYKEALGWLYRLQRFGIKPGLETIGRLLAVLKVPKPQAKVIHVAGTNGKGSVCAMIDSIVRSHGYRTGLFTSPHLVTFRERIRVNGEMICEDAVAAGLSVIGDLICDWEPHPTFFEITTALALKHFFGENLDIIILETGMGGRLDATNVLPSTVSVITPIARDHERWLGKTLREIATEKAGIIKAKMPVVSAIQRSEVEKAIRARAAECKAPLRFITQPYAASPIALRGAHQRGSAALAIAAIHAADIKIDNGAIVRGLTSVDWPARFQRFDNQIVLDGAHNPAAAQTLAAAWQEILGNQRATVILAILSDKDLHGICQALAPISDFVFLPQIRSQRAARPRGLARIISDVAPGLSYSITDSFAVALDRARAQAGPILITGSLHFAGEALAYLRGEPAAFEECAQ